MDILTKIRNDAELRQYLDDIFDFILCDEFQKPYDSDGEYKFTMGGNVFGNTAGGDEYILLDDGSVALSGSEGETGRIAETLEDFFELLVNFICISDFLCKEYYIDESGGTFCKQFKKIFNEYSEDFDDFNEVRNITAERLGIILEKDIPKSIAKKFYKTAEREPKFGCFCEGELNNELFTHVFYA